MTEKELTGSLSQFRKSEFIDATEDLAGREQSNPVETEIVALMTADDVVNKDGKKESKVPYAVLKNGTRGLRLNAGKRKILMAAAHSNSASKIKGVRVRLYQTWASNIADGGKTAVRAVGLDCFDAKAGVWLEYFRFQEARCQRHVTRMRAEMAREIQAPANPADVAPNGEEIAK